jgi:hypothetical protein
MQNRTKRVVAQLLCRIQGHQLYFVRTANNGERIFHCERCKGQFALCESRYWRRAESLHRFMHHHGHHH